jgi:hypothetical protein
MPSYRMRFTVRRIMIAVACIALAIGGFLWVTRQVVEVVELAPQPLSASTDHDLFDIVLGDLIANPDFDPAVGGRGVAKPGIVLGDTTRRGFRNAGFHFESWVVEKKVSPDVLEDLMARNRHGMRYSLARYRPSDPNILVRDLRQVDTDLGFSAQIPKARGYVETHLPGYSRDGLTALLPFTFGPTPHGAGGCYVLKKVKGRWDIIERWIYYLS